MAEKRQLRMHPRLLWDVITKQAGELQKACLESAMNSVDAGATRCDIVLKEDHFTVTDDGKGFASMEEIENFFETFGYPHEEGDAHYGRFRMGRGQLFAFGANTWRSNGFRMDVDLRPQEKTVTDQGLGYEFSTLDVPVRGCEIRVDLYRILRPSEVDDVEREIAKFVAYSPIPITVNGKVISKVASEGKWDAETDDAYFKYRESGALSLYNKGVLVTDYPAHRFGTGGIVVSKKTLDVNFARNSVIDTCPVWRRISSKIRSDAGTAIKKKGGKLNESERQSAITDLLNGRQKPSEVKDIPLFESVNGNRMSLKTLSEKLSWRMTKVGVAPLKHSTASRAHEAKLAFVFSQGTADLFGCATGTEILAKVHAALSREERDRQREHGRYHYQSGAVSSHSFDPARFKETTIEEMRKSIPDGAKDVPDGKLSAREKFALRAVRTGMNEVQKLFLNVAMVKRASESANFAYQADYAMKALEALGAGGGVLEKLLPRVDANARPRDIKAGESAVFDAWTDGTGSIWFNRELLLDMFKGAGGINKVMNIGIHEMLHDSPSTETHVHDGEFYETFHEIQARTLVSGKAYSAVVSKMDKLVREEDRRPSGALAKLVDGEFLMTRKLGAEPVLIDEEPDMDEAPAPSM